jgi:hypothetical protein
VKKTHFIIGGIAILISAMLVILVLWRKATVGEFHIGPNARNLSGVSITHFKLSSLRRTRAVWADRRFVGMSSVNTVRSEIDALMEQLPLQPDAKVAASQSCYRLLLAYRSGDWNVFKSVVIPSLHIPEAQSRKSWLDKHHALWNATFAEGGLFNEISFTVDSVSVFDMPMNQVGEVGFPTFTAVTNQNWISLTRILEPNRADLRKLDKGKVLRFFFFGRAGSHVNPYMTLFVWDKQDSVWLPWLTRIAYASPNRSERNLYFF